MSTAVSKQLFYRVTQIRSVIGMPPKTRNTMKSLGLKRRNQVVFVKVDPSTAHQLAFVKELVKVELAEEKKSRYEVNQERKFQPGFELIKNGLNEKSYQLPGKIINQHFSKCLLRSHFSTTTYNKSQEITTPGYLTWVTRTNEDQYISNANTRRVFAVERYVTDQFTEEIIGLAKQGKLAEIITKADKLTPELVAYIINKTLEKCPPMPPNSKNMEAPYFLTYNRIRFDGPYYNFINSRIPLLYEMVLKTSFEPDESLYPYYIWLYYHMNDVERILTLSDVVVNMDTRTIAYFLASFIRNYELNQFKEYYHKIIINTSHKTLPSSLLDSLIPQLINHDCIFENLFFVFQVWMNSPKCEKPSVKSISLILFEFYRFGTRNELKEFKRLIRKYGDHYLIKTIDLQNAIINRDYLNFKKTITKEDLQEIKKMIPADGDIDFYHHWLYFMIRYANMDHINFILKLYKDNNNTNSQLPARFFKLLLDYYEKHDKFIPLLQLINASKHSISYNPEYLATITRTFIYSYSRFAPLFVERLNHWLGKQFFELTQLSSQFYPYHLYKPINRRKYNDPEWEEIKFSHGMDEDVYRDQIDFRVNVGFNNVIARGIRPDFKMILDTFRFGNLDDRLILKGILIHTRQYNHKNQKTLELRSLRHPSLEKEDLMHYFTANKGQLNDSHKIYFSKLLINYDLLEEAKVLLDTIDESQLNDKAKMSKINLELRMYLLANDFDIID
ncbi:hypothetical protein G210_3617 [Candida maltosa Xu316]|uniref:Large ribosomal subunit protein uL30m n=1 Tax=Candida maltosa (strain Xu316) TaxID=1245528 RepID=M3J2Q8_CANMX|nr:hypothetical protein G210_3617 [Candida maltosa Xu316]